MPATVAIVSKCRGLDRKGCAHYPSPPTPAVLIIHFNWACIDWCDQLSCMQALSFWDSYLTKSGSAINPCHWGPPNFDLIMVGSKYSDLERFRIKENMALISIWKFLLLLRVTVSPHVVGLCVESLLFLCRCSCLCSCLLLCGQRVFPGTGKLEEKGTVQKFKLLVHVWRKCGYEYQYHILLLLSASPQEIKWFE